MRQFYIAYKDREDEIIQSGIQSLQAEYDRISREQAVTATELAYAEVISYNKKNLDRELQNESRQHSKAVSNRKMIWNCNKAGKGRLTEKEILIQ